MSILGREAKVEAVIMNILAPSDEKTRNLLEVEQMQKSNFGGRPGALGKLARNGWFRICFGPSVCGGVHEAKMEVVNYEHFG